MGLHWGYNGVTMGLHWGYIGVILGLHWGYIGGTMGLQWGYIGVTLGYIGVIWKRKWKLLLRKFRLVEIGGFRNRCGHEMHISDN